MKPIYLFILSTLLLLIAGCSTTRPLGDVALGAGGAVLAHEFSDGNPLMTAAGAAGGVLVSEGLHHVSKRQAEKAYATGYDKGRSDAAKQQYWLLIRQQEVLAHGHQNNVRLYEIPVPEQKIDGVILKPTTRHLRIEE
jgi:hypothetical protein